jgi:hypothetical protein
MKAGPRSRKGDEHGWEASLMPRNLKKNIEL